MLRRNYLPVKTAKGSKDLCHGKVPGYKYQNKKEYQKNFQLRKYYNISLAEYKILLANQDNKCAICSKVKKRKERYFAVDHNHKTGKIRGILCSKCNRGIGYLRDSKELLLKALVYLSTSEIQTKNQKSNYLL